MSILNYYCSQYRIVGRTSNAVGRRGKHLHCLQLPQNSAVDVAERPAIEVPTLTEAPAPAQTWLQVSTALWSKVATASARDAATHLFRNDTSDASSTDSTANTVNASYASLRERRDWQLFAMFAYWAGKRNINVPMLLLEAVKTTESWQGTFDAADFLFSHRASDSPYLYSSLTAPIPAVSTITVPLPPSEIEPYPVWQMARPDGKMVKEKPLQGDTAQPFAQGSPLVYFHSLLHPTRDLFGNKRTQLEQMLQLTGQSRDNKALLNSLDEDEFVDFGFGADAEAATGTCLPKPKIELDSDDSDDSDDASAFKDI